MTWMCVFHYATWLEVKILVNFYFAGFALQKYCTIIIFSLFANPQHLNLLKTFFPMMNKN